MNKSPSGGRLGMRAMSAMLAVLLVGIALIVTGTVTDARNVRGVGLLLGIFGLMTTVGLLIRWIIYQRVG